MVMVNRHVISASAEIAEFSHFRALIPSSALRPIGDPSVYFTGVKQRVRTERSWSIRTTISPRRNPSLD